MDINLQRELFQNALEELAADDDLVNQVLEVALKETDSDEIEIVRYQLPDEDYVADYASRA